MKASNYKCTKCKAIYTRISTKKWISSFCTLTGQYSRLYLQKNESK